ncbi:hypothetical protein [Chitiniphilus shinanonensis]|uniref:hypothetical protein n=1 Tax=Chitiniphilus shinanonensis TaxID=553088 RepID=UPI00306A8935
MAATAPLPTLPAPACPTPASSPARRPIAAPAACPPQRDDTAAFAVMPGRRPDPAYLGFEAADDADFPLSPAPFAASVHPAQGIHP